MLSASHPSSIKKVSRWAADQSLVLNEVRHPMPHFIQNFKSRACDLAE
jgi:hypothetical protein